MARVDDFVGPLQESLFLTSLRQKRAVSPALEALERFYEAIGRGEFEECLAFELQSVSMALAEVIGAVDHEDILDKVFSDFCIGK